jgi:hypothetical protein
MYAQGFGGVLLIDKLSLRDKQDMQRLPLQFLRAPATGSAIL